MEGGIQHTRERKEENLHRIDQNGRNMFCIGLIKMVVACTGNDNGQAKRRTVNLKHLQCVCGQMNLQASKWMQANPCMLGIWAQKPL